MRYTSDKYKWSKQADCKHANSACVLLDQHSTWCAVGMNYITLSNAWKYVWFNGWLIEIKGEERCTLPRTQSSNEDADSCSN